jgi:hypothetical protein
MPNGRQKKNQNHNKEGKEDQGKKEGKKNRKT